MIAEGRDIMYKRPAWDQRKWREMLQEKKALRKTVQVANKKNKMFGSWTSETYSRLLNDNDQPIPPGERPAEAGSLSVIHDTMESMSQWKELRGMTENDPFWTSVATQQLTSEMSKVVPESPNEDPQNIRDKIDWWDDMQNESEDEEFKKKAQDRKDDLQKDLDKCEEEWRDNAADNNNSINRDGIRTVLKKVGGKIDEMRDAEKMMRGLGYGNEFVDPSKGSKKLSRLLDQEKIRKIMELAGKLKIIAQHKQTQNPSHEPDEISDIIQGKEMEHMLPSELMLLTEGVSEDLWFKKYNEESLLQYELNSNPNKGKGAIVLSVDMSASMGGERDVWAKSMMLAMMCVAREENRRFAVNLFNGDVFLEADDEMTLDEMLSLLEYEPSGGTSFSNALDSAINLCNELHRKTPSEGPADIILITDGESSIDETVLFRMEKIKKDIGCDFYAVSIDDGGWSASSESWKKWGFTKSFKISDLRASNPDEELYREMFTL
jgi:uncharacterized protein with von Willebrand factor type A (vWA) domain